MDLYDFMKQMVAGDLAHVAVAAAFVGIIVFGIIEFWDSKKKRPQTATDPGDPGLDHNFKFWFAIVLSFALPLVAYLYVQWVDKLPVQANGIFLAGGVGYVASQGIHHFTERKDEKPDPNTNLPT